MVSYPDTRGRRLIWRATRSFMIEFNASCSSMVAMAAAAQVRECHLRSQSCMPGGPGGGDGSWPGSVRGAQAALGAPTACPGSGSGSGRDRGLWHGQGGPLHPRRSWAQPSPASAAPLGPPARQSLSAAVAPSGHRSANLNF